MGARAASSLSPRSASPARLRAWRAHPWPPAIARGLRSRARPSSLPLSSSRKSFGHELRPAASGKLIAAVLSGRRYLQASRYGASAGRASYVLAEDDEGGAHAEDRDTGTMADRARRAARGGEGAHAPR